MLSLRPPTRGLPIAQVYLEGASGATLFMDLFPSFKLRLWLLFSDFFFLLENPRICFLERCAIAILTGCTEHVRYSSAPGAAWIFLFQVYF